MPDINEIRANSRAYSKSMGLHLPEIDYSQVAVDRPRSDQIGQAYGRLQNFDHGAVPAYRQMREEVGRQFEHMTKPQSRGGLGIDVQVTKHDPYGQNSVHDVVREFRDDVVNRNRMQVLATESTGGHPFFSNDENDMFRAVHDVYGHLGSGRGIDMHGEEAAYQKHARMFSPLARRAMTTETRGQNGALHLHGEFQDQKVALLPDHMQNLQFSAPTGARRLAALRDAALENKKQGI